MEGTRIYGHTTPFHKILYNIGPAMKGGPVTNLNDRALPKRYTLNGELGAEVTSSHHRAVYSIEDFLEALHGGCTFNLSQYLHHHAPLTPKVECV